MKSTSLKKKSLSPLISTILLVVVAVILVTLLLTWGKETANTNLSRTDDITSYNILNDKRPFLSFVEAKNGMYVFDYFPPANKGDINFTISKYSLVGYNDFIPLEPEYTFSRTGRHFVPLGIINEDIFTISLLLSDGKYLNFENITNTNNSPSTSDCPDGYIPVPGNHLYGTVGKKGGFCVAKYEMKMSYGSDTGGSIVNIYPDCKNNSTNNVWDYNKCKNGNIVSTAKGSVISNITQEQSITACNSIGENYHLISNDEWMTLARNIEIVGNNWENGVVGDGFLFTGHTDKYPNGVLEASDDDNDGYYLTNDSEDINKNQRRTFYLTNGEIIWDLSGSVYEWVTPTVNFSIYGILPFYKNLNNDFFPFGSWGWLEYSNLGLGDQTEFVNNYGNFYKKNFVLLNDTYNSNNHIGKLNTRYDFINNEIERALTRGGCWDDEFDRVPPFTGLLQGTFGRTNNTTNASRGFRCTYLPE